MFLLRGFRAATEIVINPSERRLYFYVASELKKTYPVAVGKPGTPTPAGEYQVLNKHLYPGGMLGSRWMGLSIPNGNYGIHGTDSPSSIGKLISHGCIRMHNYDVEELFPQVAIGTPVQIKTIAGYNVVSAPAVAGPGSGPPLDNNVYIVQPGDTLWGIAQRHHVDLNTLISVNHLTNPDV